MGRSLQTRVGRRLQGETVGSGQEIHPLPHPALLSLTRVVEISRHRLHRLYNVAGSPLREHIDSIYCDGKRVVWTRVYCVSEYAGLLCSTLGVNELE